MLILFQLPGRCVHALNIYGKFYRQYKHPGEPERVKESGNRNDGKPDGYTLPDDASLSGFKAGGDHDSAA